MAIQDLLQKVLGSDEPNRYDYDTSTNVDQTKWGSEDYTRTNTRDLQLDSTVTDETDQTQERDLTILQGLQDQSLLAPVRDALGNVTFGASRDQMLNQAALQDLIQNYAQDQSLPGYLSGRADILNDVNEIGNTIGTNAALSGLSQNAGQAMALRQQAGGDAISRLGQLHDAGRNQRASLLAGLIDQSARGAESIRTAPERSLAGYIGALDPFTQVQTEDLTNKVFGKDTLTTDSSTIDSLIETLDRHYSDSLDGTTTQSNVEFAPSDFQNSVDLGLGALDVFF